MIKKEVAVVIPIYSIKLKQQEIIALKQVNKVLKKFDIIAAVPIGLAVEEENFTRVERFEAVFFSSINAYNRLMLSPSFYKRFQQYEYILIYQLDAFVFSDQLLYFCNLNYDYIGAPWLYGIFNYVDVSHCIWHVGNGGLSLRKVASFIKILEDRKPLQSEQIKNEDLFFSSIVDENFKIAPKEIALQFSFERQVQKCYQQNHNRLPFGCHAWERYDLKFWKPYIEQFGYTLQEMKDNSGNEDEIREKEYSFWERLADIFEKEYDFGKISQKLERIFGQEDQACVIFGAGFYGKGIARWFTDTGISIKCFCDNNLELAGKTLNGYPIIHTSRLQECKENSLIIVANYEFENQIVEQLETMSFVKEKDFITLTELVELLE